jgi:hypothetical protein
MVKPRGFFCGCGGAEPKSGCEEMASWQWKQQRTKGWQFSMNNDSAWKFYHQK